MVALAGAIMSPLHIWIRAASSGGVDLSSLCAGRSCARAGERPIAMAARIHRIPFAPSGLFRSILRGGSTSSQHPYNHQCPPPARRLTIAIRKDDGGGDEGYSAAGP